MIFFSIIQISRAYGLDDRNMRHESLTIVRMNKEEVTLSKYTLYFSSEYKNMFLYNNNFI